MFGININPTSSGIERAIKIAEVAESSGLDIIGVQDHPYESRFLDAWIFLTYLATHTKRLHFMPTVSDLPLRPPAMLAKAASSLDILTKGRVELGIGAGAILPKIESYGGPALTPGGSVSAFEEAIRVIRIILQQREVGAEAVNSFEGKFYHLNDVHTGPVDPNHRIRIWVGNNAGSRMLQITGRLGDGWISPLQSYLPTSRVKDAQRVIDDSAIAKGRSPSSIRRLRLVAGIIDSKGGMTKSLHGEGNLVVGSVEDWVNELLYYNRELGLESFIFWPYAKGENAEMDQITLFSDNVVPGVKGHFGAN